jgi:NAD-dependent DNA ligase
LATNHKKKDNKARETFYIRRMLLELQMEKNRRSNLNARRLDDRYITEFIGICRGVLADGVIVKPELQFLLSWLEQHPSLIDQWPCNEMYQIFSKALAEGNSDKVELELLDVISKFTGMASREDDNNASTSLPLDDPMPKIIFDDHGFCFTGQFENKTRKQCQDLVVEKGGYCRKDPSRNITYLIIGNKNSSAWMQSSFGRKIEKAMKLKDDGHPIAILSEDHWEACI